MKRVFVIVLVMLFFSTSGIIQGQGIQKFADLGDFRLENGQIIRNCKLGYRTFGTLDEKKSNAVLVPTWFTGTSEALSPNVGPGKIFDDTHNYIILVDALGNGVSSSPSNSTAQPGTSFPEITIVDMVKSEYKFVTETLHLTHLRAVSGISMGGMQTFQWMVSYPDFMDNAIPMVGSPCQTVYDLLLWTTELSAIEALHGKPDGDRLAMEIIGGIHALALSTPANVNQQAKPEDFPRFFADLGKSVSQFDIINFAWQLKAMLGHSIYKPFGGSKDKAAAAIKTHTLVIVSRQDHMVNPEPSLELASLIGAKTLVLTTDCGHLGTGCESEKIGEAVSDFLKQK
jgi:homoserine O-acetyltransferase